MGKSSEDCVAALRPSLMQFDERVTRSPGERDRERVCSSGSGVYGMRVAVAD